jgi:hypothetical protein
MTSSFFALALKSRMHAMTVDVRTGVAMLLKSLELSTNAATRGMILRKALYSEISGSS